MKRVVRLNERDLTKLIKRVIVENAPTGGQMCVADKPDSGRPLCTEININSGKLIVMLDVDLRGGGGMAFLQYKDQANCPKLCKVANETVVTLSK